MAHVRASAQALGGAGSTWQREDGVGSNWRYCCQNSVVRDSPPRLGSFPVWARSCSANRTSHVKAAESDTARNE